VESAGFSSHIHPLFKDKTTAKIEKLCGKMKGPINRSNKGEFGHHDPWRPLAGRASSAPERRISCFSLDCGLALDYPS